MSDCCSVPINDQRTPSQCRLCGQKGRTVRRLTIEHLLKEPALTRLADHSYYFCTTPTCAVVYFSNEANSYFYKRDVKVRVGLKETVDPVPICYCFGFTKKMVLDEIREMGYSTIPDTIRAEIKAGNCACEVKNPSGHCCLGTVMQVVLKGSNGHSQGLGEGSAAAGQSPAHDCCASVVEETHAISE